MSPTFSSKSSQEMTREAHAELLRAHSLRVTASRLAVLAFLEGSEEAVSFQDVLQALQDRSWNQSTLYRNLIDMTAAGLLEKSEIDGLAHFERAGRVNACAEHPHFVCTKCGLVSHLEETNVCFDGPLPLAVKEGDISIQIRGLCDLCLQGDAKS